MIRIIRLRQPNSVQTIYACWGIFMIGYDRYNRVRQTCNYPPLQGRKCDISCQILMLIKDLHWHLCEQEARGRMERSEGMVNI